MEPFKDPKDALARKYVNEAGIDKAPQGTYDAIMKQIEALNAYSISYKPLISRKGWFLIATFVLIFFVGLFWVPIERFYLDTLPEMSSLKISEVLAKLELSKTTLYAIGFLGLFLIQLPFLKRILDSKKA